MDNPIIENPKVEDEEEEVTVKDEVQEPEIVAGSTSPLPIIDYEARKLARDAKAKRKDEKTVQQVLKSLDNLKSPEEKLSAMCKKYSELLHENRQLQGTVKQSEKNIIMIHREKEQFRHERSKAVLAKTRMEQLCRELQKLNKAQQEETALKLRVEEEKRKEICITFQSAFAEMNTLTNQNNEKSAKMREENLEMREKIKSVRERIELTETQLDKVRQQAKLELELAREKLVRVTLELTSEKEALMEDKSQLLMKLAKYHVRVKEHEGTELFLRKQIKIYEEKFEEFKKDVEKTTESLKNFRPDSREMKQKLLKLEKETALWKQRWKKTNAAILQISEIKEKRDAEMVTLNNKLSTLQELCKVFQRERTSLLNQLREKNETGNAVNQTDRKPQQSLNACDENRKSLKQVESISKDCEKLKDNLSKLEGSLSEAVREACKATVYEEETAVAEQPKANKKINRKTKKNEGRNKSNQKKDEKNPDDLQIQNSAESNLNANETATETLITEQSTDEQSEKSSIQPDDNKIETCAAEIEILERHETVLKDIENVLAEQAILEAKIACVKEMGKTINDPDIIPSNDDKLPETLQLQTDKLDIDVENTVNEENSSPDCRTIKNLENKTNDDDSGLSITEFEIVDHGSRVPDQTNSETESTIEIQTDTVKSDKLTPSDKEKLDDSLEKHEECVSEKKEADLTSAETTETTKEQIIVV